MCSNNPPPIYFLFYEFRASSGVPSPHLQSNVRPMPILYFDIVHLNYFIFNRMSSLLRFFYSHFRLWSSFGPFVVRRSFHCFSLICGPYFLFSTISCASLYLRPGLRLHCLIRMCYELRFVHTVWNSCIFSIKLIINRTCLPACLLKCCWFSPAQRFLVPSPLGLT
jgi:hypothetical protein